MEAAVRAHLAMKRLALLVLTIVSPGFCFAQVGGKGKVGARAANQTPSASAAAFYETENVLLVDGIKYKSLASALAACSVPGCIVIDNLAETFNADPFAALPANVFAEVRLTRRTWITNASITLPNKSQLIGSGRGDAGSTGTVIQAGASFPRGAPVIQMGAAPISAGVRIENLTVDCNNKSGAVGIQNLWSQEESGVRHALMVNCPKYGLDVERSSAQNSGPYEDLELLNIAECTNCSAATVPIVVNNVSVFRGVHGATVNSDGATPPDIGMQVDSPGTFSDIHCEHVKSCLVIGSRSAVGAAIATNIECGPAVSDCVTFSNAFSSQNLTALNIASTSGNLLTDQRNGTTINALTEGGSLAIYATGNGSAQSVLTSSVNFHSRFPGIVLQGPAGGSVTHLAPSAGGSNTITDPAATGTTSLAVVAYCGATTGSIQACADSVQTLPIMVWGDVLLNSSAFQSITNLPFTDASYSCTGSDRTTESGIVTFSAYAPSSVTVHLSKGENNDHLRYLCVGH